MQHWLRTVVFGAAVLGAGHAAAQPISGFYVGGGAGFSNQANANSAVPPVASSAIEPPSDHLNLTWRNGYIGVLGVGYGFAPWGLRVELSGSYRNYGQWRGDSLVFSRHLATGGGETNAWQIGLDLLLDINLSRFGLDSRWVVPYAGMGIGYTWRELRNAGGGIPGNSINVNGTSGGMNYQFIFGLYSRLHWMGLPSWLLGVEYRYMFPEADYYTARVTGPAGDTRLQRIDVASHSNNILVTLRYNFGSVRRAPPHAAAPAVAPVRTFLVLFDFDSAALTDRARSIVAQAADTARSQSVTRIELAGHTDTTGRALYNEQLSLRRANAVAAELTRLGVDRGSIQVTGYGASRPLVPTGPNVREPQNRRVEIALR